MLSSGPYKMLKAATTFGSLLSVSANPIPQECNSPPSPKLVFGTYRLKDTETLGARIQEAVQQHGISLIDTALLYGNQEAISQICKDIGCNATIGTKVHQQMHAGALFDYLKQESLAGRVYERVLLHKPLPIYMWRDLEEAVDAGLVKSIGISNVDLVTLQSLVQVARIKPAVVQGEFHAFLPDLEATFALIEYCNSEGIEFEAHSILGGVSTKKSTESVLNDLASALQVSVDNVVEDLVTWVRVKAPKASLCIKSSQSDRLSQLVKFGKASPLKSIESLEKAIETLNLRFRRYALPAKDSKRNLLLASLEGKSLGPNFGLKSRIVLPKDGGAVSEELVDRISGFVESDSEILLSTVKTENVTGIAWQLHGRKGYGDVNLFTRVAIKLFAKDKEKGTILANLKKGISRR